MSKEDRDRVLRCPFCKTILREPVEIDTSFGGSVEGGFCGCGTVFVYDRTGRREGEAFMEAMAMAHNWDYDAATSASEDSYEEASVRFDRNTGFFFYNEDIAGGGGGAGGKIGRGPKFCFIKRKKTA